MKSNYTRVEIIDHTSTGKGRVYTLHPENWLKDDAKRFTVKESVQDGGKTLKIFIGEDDGG